MFLDFLTDLCKFIFLTFAAIFMLFSLPFVLLHVSEHWKDDEYPHSGFSPECPVYIAPEEEAEFCPVTHK